MLEMIFKIKFWGRLESPIILHYDFELPVWANIKPHLKIKGAFQNWNMNLTYVGPWLKFLDRLCGLTNADLSVWNQLCPKFNGLPETFYIFYIYIYNIYIYIYTYIYIYKNYYNRLYIWWTWYEFQFQPPTIYFVHCKCDISIHT